MQRKTGCPCRNPPCPSTQRPPCPSSPPTCSPPVCILSCGSDIWPHTRLSLPVDQSAYLIGEMCAATSRLAPLPPGGSVVVHRACSRCRIMMSVTMAWARTRLAGRCPLGEVQAHCSAGEGTGRGGGINTRWTATTISLMCESRDAHPAALCELWPTSHSLRFTVRVTSRLAHLPVTTLASLVYCISSNFLILLTVYIHTLSFTWGPLTDMKVTFRSIFVNNSAAHYLRLRPGSTAQSPSIIIS